MSFASAAVSAQSASGGMSGGSLARSCSGVAPLAADMDSSSTAAAVPLVSAGYLQHQAQGSRLSCKSITACR